jgi:uncharacterized membrane protein HdeD (DUF308 family)
VSDEAERVPMQAEAKYTVVSLVVLGITMIIPGGRVLVLPVLFLVLLVLLFWAAKPRPED